MNTAYDNNLYQMPSFSPDSDAPDHVFETRYNAAYSSQPNTPSGQLIHPAATIAHGAHDVDIDEQAFGQSVESFMAEHNMRKTLKQFVSSCLNHSRQLREEALQNQHRAVRLMHLQAEASALEAEAATWELLLHMYAETRRTYPAGLGGQQTATTTVHHQVAETICDRHSLQQCARVVAWLEALFQKSQDYRAEQEQGPRFHNRSGVWTDTHNALLRQDQINGLVSELDPDATTRQASSLHKDSSRDEDALNAYLFGLVKAGRVKEAAETCAACGQPWRAASLLGGGPNGPLPLGPAADAQGQVKALEQLAAEVEANSSIALRSIWKWTCYQVAEAAAQHCSHLSESSGKHEAAVYGALAGHLQRVLPVCHTRADILWAYTRCWLESQVDRRLADSSGKGDLVSGLRLGKDAVASTQPQEVHRVVLDDVSDFWPPSSLTEALPDTLEAVLEAAQQAADTQSMGDAQQWQLHRDIITENFATLLSRFLVDGSTQASSGSSMKDRQQAVKLRIGAHLGLALGYLPVPVPTPQDALTIRTQEDIQADPDGDVQHLNSSDDLPLQETTNQLLEQYVLHLIKTEQHELVPLYACLMRKDMRRKTYASYLHGLTLCPMEQCWQAYDSAQRRFRQWPRGDIEIHTELDEIAEQVMHEAFWRVQDGPNQWPATLRWLCLSDTTLLLATKEANRVLRQLSLGGQAAMQAGLHYAFEALRASPTLSSILDDEDGLTDISAQDPAIARECQELLVWQDFYQLEGLHTDIATLLADIDPEDETQLDKLFQLGHRYIGSAVEVCSSSSFDSIWTGQDSPYDTGSPSHEVVLWVAPADNASNEPVQDGKYSWVPSDQMADFVAAVQGSADTACVPGITAQVKEADCQAAAVTLTVSHADTDVGTEVQCLNAIIKGCSSQQSGSVPLHLIRMKGPDMCIGALAAMAAYPHLLLHAAQLRQILLEDPDYGFRPELGDEIVPLVAGTDPDKSTGLTYYFTQQELKQLLELERLTQLQIEMLHEGQFIA